MDEVNKGPERQYNLLAGDRIFCRPKATPKDNIAEVQILEVSNFFVKFRYDYVQESPKSYICRIEKFFERHEIFEICRGGRWLLINLNQTK